MYVYISLKKRHDHYEIIEESCPIFRKSSKRLIFYAVTESNHDITWKFAIFVIFFFLVSSKLSTFLVLGEIKTFVYRCITTSIKHIQAIHTYICMYIIWWRVYRDVGKMYGSVNILTLGMSSSNIYSRVGAIVARTNCFRSPPRLQTEFPLYRVRHALATCPLLSTYTRLIRERAAPFPILFLKPHKCIYTQRYICDPSLLWIRVFTSFLLSFSSVPVPFLSFLPLVWASATFLSRIYTHAQL